MTIRLFFVEIWRIFSISETSTAIWNTFLSIYFLIWSWKISSGISSIFSVMESTSSGILRISFLSVIYCETVNISLGFLILSELILESRNIVLVVSWISFFFFWEIV